MIDEHTLPSLNWGIRPILFNIGKIPIDSYSFFIVLGLIIGLIIFYKEAKKQKSVNENTFFILIAAFVGGILGAKIPIWIINFKKIIASFPDFSVLLSGRTIVGGLIGGTFAVLILKKYLKIKEKKGNLFAPAVAIGVAIGRVGCFLRGCCYGKPTNLPWGVNFGDGIFRHPTQIYESIFMIILFVYLNHAKKKNPEPGKLFKILLMSYFTFRFFIEFIRVEPVIFLGLTLFQWISVVALIFIYRKNLKSFINNKVLFKK